MKALDRKLALSKRMIVRWAHRQEVGDSYLPLFKQLVRRKGVVVSIYVKN